MKITIGLIVFNGEPFIDLYLKHYLSCPDIDYVVVSEGATKNMVDVLGLKNASSTDNTIEILKKYSGNPKLKYVCAKTPYPEKIEQQNAYARLIPNDTDYVWVADSDEFYHYSDIAIMKEILKECNYTWVDMPQYHFWKNTNTIGVGGDGWGYKAQDRIFKYYKGQLFTSHRPITICDKKGISVKDIKPLYSNNVPIVCYHYSYIIYKNVYEKMLYYERTFNRPYLKDWFYPVWCKWQPETAHEIESKYSIHPTVPGAKTKIVNLIHPINILDL